MNNKVNTKLQLFLVVLASSTSISNIFAYSHSHSFFRSRPIVTESTLEKSLSLYAWRHREEEDYKDKWIFAELSGFYYNSINHDRIAPYFLKDGKRSLLLGQNNTSDISTAWFLLGRNVTGNNTANAFSGVFTASPSRIAAGGAINIHIDIERLLKTYTSLFNNWWLQIFTPVVYVNHRLDMREKDFNGPGLVLNVSGSTGATTIGFPNFISALNNPSWEFGKWSPCPMRKTGLGDIKILLAYDFIKDDNNACSLHKSDGSVYGAVYIPTTRGSHAHFVFEPTLGTGSHAGLAFGLQGERQLKAKSSHTLSVVGNVEATYLIPAQERRSFDLCLNGDWSRYLLIVNESTPRTQLFGINYLTQTAHVSPRAMFDLFIAMHYKYKKASFEFGYNFWARLAEHVGLPHCFNDNLQPQGIYDIHGRCSSADIFTTDSNGTISSAELTPPNEPKSDPSFVTIKVTDFNTSSAACPSAVTSTFYVAADYRSTIEEYPFFIGMGIAYESSSRKRTALEQIGIWAKGSISF